MKWTADAFGEVLHDARGGLLAERRRLATSGVSAWLCPGIDWDVSEQLTVGGEPSTRWFATAAAAKRAVEAAVAAHSMDRRGQVGE
jgi:hypothetical protein